MKFIDDRSKNLKWWNRNYFFVGTIIVIIINILLFAICGNDWQSFYSVDSYDHWHNVFYFAPTIRSLLNAFSHANWQHVLLNMLCFAVAGSYLERKKGTFGTILYVLFGVYFSGIAVIANDLSIYYHGFSGVNYFIYAVTIIEYLFSFRHQIRNKTNIVLGGIIVALIYLAMCFNGETSGFSFALYPYDLMTNLGHYSSFVVGLILALIIQTTRFLAVRQKIK